MNVPAKQIAEQMQKQAQRLNEAIAQSNQQSVRECVAVIEAYCQLLKGESQHVKNVQHTVHSLPTSSSPISPTVPLDEEKNESGNLLDF